jgi:hypothetical protein
VAFILENRNYEVSRDVYNFFNAPYLDVVATKDIGKSFLIIQINLWRKELLAFSGRWEFSILLPFRDYSMDELLKEIRKRPNYRTWRYACLDRDFGKCQNIGCAIDTNQSYLLDGKLLDVHHLKPLRKIIEENNIHSLDDAIKCAEIWNLNNGITLCGFCHRTVTKFERKGIQIISYLRNKKGRGRDKENKTTIF